MSAQTDLQAEVLATFNDEGLTFAATLTQATTLSNFNATTGVFDTIVTTDNTTVRVLFDTIPRNLGEVDQTQRETKAGQEFCWMASNGAIPRSNDKLTVGSDVYIIEIAVDAAVGANALYRIWMNKGS